MVMRCSCDDLGIVTSMKFGFCRKMTKQDDMRKAYHNAKVKFYLGEVSDLVGGK